MKYRFIKNGKDFDIFEIQTESVIKTFSGASAEKEARKFVKFLNNGETGWNGFTPTFVLKKMVIPTTP